MVAPKAPEGGWKKWFLDHPYQRTRYPILRSHNVRAVFDRGEGWSPQSSGVPEYEYVEMWYDSRDHMVYANLNSGPTDGFATHDRDPEEAWTTLTENLFNRMVASGPPTPPDPLGTGWDDFDWSR